MAADIEVRLISRVIRDRNIEPLLDIGVDDEWFVEDEGLQLFRFARDHYLRYGECPSAVTVKEILPGYRVLREQEGLPYLLDHFVAMHREYQVVTMLGDALDFAQRGDTDSALGSLEKAILRVTPKAPSGLGADPLADELALMKATSRNGEDLDDLPEPQPLIADTIDRNTITFLIGWTGAAKTWTAIDWAMHICNGFAWNGRPVTQGKVLYILAEGASGAKTRLAAWKRRYGGDASNLTLKYTKVRLVEDAKVIARWAKDDNYVLVVIDTLARNKDGQLEESSSTDMGKLINAADDIRVANDTCVLVIHHTGKDRGGPRGSSTFDCDADTIYKATLDQSLLTLERTKRREGPTEDTVLLELVEDRAGGCHLDGTTERVLERSQDPFTTQSPKDRVLHSTYAIFATREVKRQELLDRAVGPGLSRDHAVKMLAALLRWRLRSRWFLLHRQRGRQRGHGRVLPVPDPGPPLHDHVQQRGLTQHSIEAPVVYSRGFFMSAYSAVGQLTFGRLLQMISSTFVVALPTDAISVRAWPRIGDSVLSVPTTAGGIVNERLVRSAPLMRTG